jgi:hypothetical protein
VTTERIDEVREATLHLGEHLNRIVSHMGKCNFESCAAFLPDAKTRMDALEKLVSENPVVNQLGDQAKRLSGAIREAADLALKAKTRTHASRSGFVMVAS